MVRCGVLFKLMQSNVIILYGVGKVVGALGCVEEQTCTDTVVPLLVC